MLNDSNYMDYPKIKNIINAHFNSNKVKNKNFTNLIKKYNNNLFDEIVESDQSNIFDRDSFMEFNQIGELDKSKLKNSLIYSNSLNSHVGLVRDFKNELDVSNYNGDQNGSMKLFLFCFFFFKLVILYNLLFY